MAKANFVIGPEQFILPEFYGNDKNNSNNNIKMLKAIIIIENKC